MAYQPPTAEQAQVFAELVDCGIPSCHAAMIANPEIDLAVSVDVGKRWERDGAVRSAQVLAMGGDWRKLTDEQRFKYALKRHYNQIAYFMATHNWGESQTSDLAKLDKGRDALEKKLAGTAGLGDPTTAFWEKALRGELSGLSVPKRPEAAH